MYTKPSIAPRQNQLTRDEWWQIPVVIFVLRVYNNHAMQQAVASCERSGGVPEVTSKFFGSSWEVKCLKK